MGKQCVCGTEMEFKSGTSKKNGKPYKMWKCPGCGEAEFIKEPKKQFNGTANKSESGNNTNGKPAGDARSFCMSYAKDIVVAEIAKGDIKEPFKRVADGFKLLFSAYNNPYQTSNRVSSDQHEPVDQAIEEIEF